MLCYKTSDVEIFTKSVIDSPSFGTASVHQVLRMGMMPMWAHLLGDQVPLAHSYLPKRVPDPCNPRPSITSVYLRDGLSSYIPYVEFSRYTGSSPDLSLYFLLHLA